MSWQKVLLFVATLLFLSACSSEARYRVLGKPKHPLVFTRYEQDFFEDGRIEDSVFRDLFSNRIMQFGSVGEACTDSFLELFRPLRLHHAKSLHRLPGFVPGSRNIPKTTLSGLSQAVSLCSGHASAVCIHPFIGF